MKQEYKEGETTLKDAQALAIKVLSKTLDMTKLTPEKGSLIFFVFIFALVFINDFLTMIREFIIFYTG